MKDDSKNNFIPVFLKILIFSIIFFKRGILISIFATYFLDYIYYIIIKIIFGLTPLTGYDEVFITTKQINRVTVLWSLKFSNFNTEKMKNFIIKKIIKQIGKFRSKLIFKFGEYFWKEFPFNEEIQKQNIIIKEKITNEELENYINNETNKEINIFLNYLY